jgi:NADH-quinone oxidoreductase subunit J
MTIEFFVFLAIAMIAVLAAIGLLLSRNAIYAAMFLILNMISLGGIYLLLNAPFIAAVQIAVYAGAIMVLVTFVIMLLGAEKLSTVDTKPGMRWQRPLALVLGVALAIFSVLSLFLRGGLPAPAAPIDASPLAIGRALFTTYLLPFEVASILLLAAMVGAVVLTRKN